MQRSAGLKQTGIKRRMEVGFISLRVGPIVAAVGTVEPFFLSHVAAGVDGAGSSDVERPNWMNDILSLDCKQK